MATAVPEVPADSCYVSSCDAGAHPDAPSDPTDAADATRGTRKTAWNRPSNGAGDLGAVMDAAAWPLLSESARASSKSSSSESLKSLSELPPATAPPEPANPIPDRLPKPVQANPGAAPPVRQRSMKRGGNVNAAIANGEPVPTTIPHSGDRPLPVEIPARDASGKIGGAPGWEQGSKFVGFSPQGHGRSEHHRGYGNNRKGNSGGGMHHNGNSPRQDQDRWVYDMNHYNFTGKNPPVSPHHRAVPRPIFHGPIPSHGVYMGPPSPARPYAAHVHYPELPGSMMFGPAPHFHHDPIRVPVPFIPQPMVYFSPDHHIANANAILKQIEYYFSNDNLCHDMYLRQQMDEQGWVSVNVIANFNRVKKLTDNIYFILESVRASSVVEVQGDKLRRRNEWQAWVIRPQINSVPDPQSANTPGLDNLAGRMRSMGLGVGTHGSGTTQL